MATQKFHGIFPYLVSPVDNTTGKVKEAVLRRLVEHLIAQGVHGLSPLGSTGEFAYLSFEQKLEIVRIVVEAANGRVPVVPGVAAYATADAIQQAERFLEMGVDGIILVLQTFFSLDKAAVERYFRTVAEAIPCPIVIYTNPQLLGSDVTPDIVVALSELPNIQYVKDATSNTGRILTILNRAGERVQVFSASAHVPLLTFHMGAVGWMAGPACVLPATCVQLYELAKAGRWDEAWELQKPMWQVNEIFQKYSLAACIKMGLQLQGFEVGDPIPPQSPLSAAAVEDIRQVLTTLGAIA
ncbi:MAG: dihydrodipicolinate synthase family protein [Caldilineaceae bacterium]|nr:dihydrodipicolinate synthase family protein [Caldilineaceae bacterium]